MNTKYLIRYVAGMASGLCLLLAVVFNAAAISLDDYLLKAASSEQKLTLIDIRTPSQFAQSHLPNAINIPAQIIGRKRLPPLGDVVVYGDGVDLSVVQKAVEQLNAKRGINAEILDGGFSAWLSSQSIVQEKQGLELRDIHHLTFQKLEKIATYDPSVVLVDIRKLADKTSLQTVFGNVKILSTDLSQSSEAEIISSILSYSTEKSDYLFVLIDDGDDSGENIVHKLHAASMKRVAVLMGGEIALKTRGEMSEAIQVFGK